MSEVEEKENKEKSDFEAKHNLLGFFDLLLKIDKRSNPHLYERVKNNENNRDTNNPD